MQEYTGIYKEKWKNLDLKYNYYQQIIVCSSRIISAQKAHNFCISRLRLNVLPLAEYISVPNMYILNWYKKVQQDSVHMLQYNISQHYITFLFLTIT